MDSKLCTKCGRTSTSSVKCSHCGFEFPQPRTRDDEMEDRLINEGNKPASEATEGEMDEAMNRPLKIPRPQK
jgi:ribosomal protein L37E